LLLHLHPSVQTTHSIEVPTEEEEKSNTMSSIVDVVFGRPIDDTYEEDNDNDIDHTDDLTATSIENQLQHHHHQQQHQRSKEQMNDNQRRNMECLICYEVFDLVEDDHHDDEDDNLVVLHHRDYNYHDSVSSSSPPSSQQERHDQNPNNRTMYKCEYDLDLDCNHQVCDGCLTQHTLLQLQEHRLPIYCPCSIRTTTDGNCHAQNLQNRNARCPAQLPFKTIKRLLKAYDNGGGRKSDDYLIGYGSITTDGNNNPRENTEGNVSAQGDSWSMTGQTDRR